MIEFIVLLICIGIVMIYIYNNMENDNSIESFEGTYFLNSCPSGYKTINHLNGDIGCCSGTVIGSQCISTGEGISECSLNSNTSKKPYCVKVIMDDYKKKGESLCPSNMPNYFENLSIKSKGCTEGLLSSDLIGPRTTTQPLCKIYSSLDENLDMKDSCHNQKLLTNFKCFGNNCKKSITQPTPDVPALIHIMFSDNEGLLRTAYPKQSYENYLNKVNPDWKNKGINLSKNIQVAEVAKQYYIENSITKNDVQF
jgi:hypothetical protein